MKTWIVFLIIIVSCAYLVSQVPDDFVPGLRELTTEDWEYLNSIPRMTLNDIDLSRELPVSVDNTQQTWLRPIFNQDGGSCGQASAIGYTFTYEIDRLRELSADIPAHQYPDHYTWNFLNGGVANGSWHFDGWRIVEAGGCPTIETYGGMFVLGQSGWMDGYDNYRSAMTNRVQDIFAIDVSTPEGLETLKYWFYEHGNEEESGGLVCFAAGVSGLEQYILPLESAHAGEMIIADWTMPVNHAITFAGYDDDICYDYNGDGEFTNDIDINGDDIVDMRDWEIGAVKMINSWGPNWANDGFCWVMYRTLAEPTETGGIWGNLVHGIHVREEYEPLLTLKTTISHDLRYTIRIGAGVSVTPGATEPEVTMTFPHFNFQGGEWNLPGNMLPGAQPLEIGLDITPLLSEIDPQGDMKWWLIVESSDPDYNGNGTMISYSIIDEVTGEEYICEQANWGLIDEWINYFSVDAQLTTETVEIITEELPPAYEGMPYEFQLSADYGNEPYHWAVKRNYNESSDAGEFPILNWQPLDVTDNDDGWAVIDLPFTFKFYDEEYDQVTFITDGSVVFAENFSYVRNENHLKSTKCITVYGADLAAYTEYGDGFYYLEEADRVLMRWTVSLYGQESFDADFALAINSDSSIEFFYNPAAITSASNWVAGVSYGDNLSYLFSEVSGSYAIPENMVWQYNAVPFPEGISITSTGLLQGIYQSQSAPVEQYELNIKVWDNMNLYDEKILTFTGEMVAEDVNELVSVISLGQNYPNPFHSSSIRNQFTTIDLNLQQSQDVSLAIYNLKGQRVCRIFEGILPAGKHSLSWDGRNENGVSLGSGVYFYKLQSGNTQLSRKLLLIK